MSLSPDLNGGIFFIFAIFTFKKLPTIHCFC